MFLRTLLMMIKSRRKSHLDFREVGRLTMRVMPNDLDILRHVNNGIYLSLMDRMGVSLPGFGDAHERLIGI